MGYVAEALRARGYQVLSELNTSERGIDIEAEHPRRGVLYIEAKGATSSKRGTARYGRPFTRAQARTHLAVALLAIAQLRDRYGDEPVTRFAIALPEVEPHVELAESISESLAQLQVQLIWVRPSGRVRFPPRW